MKRDLVMFAVVLVLLGLAVAHGLRSDWLALSVDLALMYFALFAWKPWTRIRPR